MFNNNIIKSIFIVQIIGLIFSLVFGYVNVDSLEHLRMSWLVSQGYVPYRDFFEHHHPLLWYIYLPFTVLLPHNFMLVLYFSRVFCLIFSALMVFIVCKIIKRYMGGKELIPYFLVIMLSFYPVWWCYVTLKPEILARLLYFLGIYMFFRYSEKYKTKYLVYSGIAFAVSFIAIQNIIFSVIPLIIPLFYLWDKNPKVGKDVLLSSIAPLAIIGTFVGLIYFSGTWKNYYELCWIFNSKLFELLYYEETSKLLYWCVPVAMGVCFWLYQVYTKQSSFYINTIGLLLCCEIVQRILAKAAWHHYLILTFIFVSMVAAPVVSKIKKCFLRRMTYVVLIGALVMNLAYLGVFHYNGYAMKIYNRINSSPENSVANIVFQNINIWEPKKSYYVLFLGLTLIDNYLFDRDPDYDINKYIEENKIKYLDWEYEPFTPLYFDGAEFFERFNIKPSIMKKYIMVNNSLWQRIDTIEPKMANEKIQK